MLTNELARKVLLVLSGPSGSGKTTLEKAISLEQGLTTVVTTTTRAPRPSEHNGEHYYFVNSGTFTRMKDVGHFIEWTYIYDCGYGLSHQEVMRATRNGTTPAIVILNSVGYLRVKELWPDVWGLWVDVTCADDLRQRLTRRGDTPDQIKKRLASVAVERAAAVNAGYTFTICNDVLAQGVEQLRVVLAALRLRR